MKRFDVVIAGAGQGGANAAITLRKLGFEGSIALVGRERDLPYERPPLSKEYLSGVKPFDRLLIRPQQFWAERKVTLLLNNQVTRVDPESHSVECDGIGSIGYGKLIWAAGGRRDVSHALAATFHRFIPFAAGPTSIRCVHS